MKTHWRMLALVAVWLPTGCGDSQLSWKEYSPPGGGFKVLMPGTPTEKDESHPGEQGPVAIKKFQIDREKGNEVYLVMQVDYPPAYVNRLGQKKMLDLAAKSVLQVLFAEEESRKPVSLNNVPGLEVKGVDTLAKTIVFARAFLSGSRIYIVTAAGKEKNLSTEHAFKFLDSFELTK